MAGLGAQPRPRLLSTGPLAYSMASSASCTHSPIWSSGTILAVRHAAVDAEERLGAEVLAHAAGTRGSPGRAWPRTAQMLQRRAALGDVADGLLPAVGLRSWCRPRPSSRRGSARRPASGPPSISPGRAAGRGSSRSSRARATPCRARPCRACPLLMTSRALGSVAFAFSESV